MKKKASALILGLIVIVVLTILGGALLSYTISENHSAQRHLESTQAFWLAEAGIQEAIEELRNGDWSGWVDKSGKRSKLASLGQGEYYVSVNNPKGDNPTINAEGYIPSRDAARIQRSIEVIVERDTVTDSSFRHAAFGLTYVTTGASDNIDSYDSSRGPYGGTNVGSNGHVGTNSNSSSLAIAILGSGNIKGNAGTGPKGEVYYQGTGRVIGEITHDNRGELPSVKVPKKLRKLLSKGDKSIWCGLDNIIMPGGNYKYQSLKKSGKGNLIFSGPTNIYLTEASRVALLVWEGDIVVSDGAQVRIYTDGRCDFNGLNSSVGVNRGDRPEKFIIYSTKVSPTTGINISGDVDFYGAVYAPGTRVVIGDKAELYGAFVGDRIIKTGSGGIHYDEALANLGGGGSKGASQLIIQSWKEEQNPYP